MLPAGCFLRVGFFWKFHHRLISLAARISEYRKTRKLTEPPDWADKYHERFIPYSKGVLVKMLLKDFYASTKEKEAFEYFIKNVDSSLSLEYHSILENLKTAYEPINPDRDTLPENTLSSSERLSQESLVLHKLCGVIEQANFNELPEDLIAYALSKHHSIDGTQVYVNIDRYEYMKFWALGQRLGLVPVKQKLLSKLKFFGSSTTATRERRYFKRVMVAARLKNGHMILKSFKDIPLESIEQLLPEVRIRMSFFDKTLLNATLLIGGSIIFVNVGMVMLADLKIGTSFLLFVFAAFMAFRTWKVFVQRRNIHSLELSHTLYFRSTSNNMDLLVALTQRAQEEHTKEMILAYTFQKKLLPQSNLSGSIGGETMNELNKEIQLWLYSKCGLEIHFNICRAVENLQRLNEREQTDDLHSFVK
ncbi:transmembrane protein 143 [Protopterus annectens]|uniref:transmembrane protein 143 n=1 Tax=Protopterus annectens TaxID=7888 RepID=UPI001CF96B46|nr:transmembrane protein 143 [Protopterus annectens]